MSAILQEGKRRTGVDHGQSTNGSISGERVIIMGAEDGDGFQVIYQNEQPPVLYLPGDPALPLTLDDGATVDAVRSATPVDFMEPML